ncbi:capsule polysaccharide biosynthesis protein [Pseudomassariella vexata]|uniref:Capsule polysaccharide biosynthesis protein n=1 Tax=Pseudomassariella vexata TaxID=1141098 RepID=A0A1Y2EBY1_9PEZI|nr:capsule polysaccharide biosynthesis protein [Pseudomassariella vexata]ORY69080.1 capsule polysaccharide biosynthesis protein [Pseudomassariella vexata]
MASSAGWAQLLQVSIPASIASLVYGLFKSKTEAQAVALSFFTGPGKTSRIVALVVVLVNWKSLPLAWTVRVFNAMISHILVRPFHTHSPDKLFHPVISQSHVSLLEVDYNLHKSNSTYFADLDVSRSHLVSHLFARGCHALAHNAVTKLVEDPRKPGQFAKGKFSVVLGAVHCSFKKEIAPYQGYEMWTSVLSWDRKWIYLLTHFVEKGAAKPKSWDAAAFGPTRKNTTTEDTNFEKKIFATAVSKYVFKIGRLTVHPAILIGASGLLPERPDGWVSTEGSGMATPSEPVTGNGDAQAKIEVATTGWDWTRTEEERMRGMQFAQHFAAVDGAASLFNGGEDGALGRFGLG